MKTRSRRLLVSFSLTASLCALAFFPQWAYAQDSSPSPLSGTEQGLGVFTIGGQSFAVSARNENASASANSKPTATLEELEIRDANQGVVYREDFSPIVENDQVVRGLSVSASLLEGSGGQALLLRFLEESDTAGATESWQMFGLVNGSFTRYGPPLPLGQGAGIAVNGVLTGVMLSGGIGVVPLASTADALEFRVWSGNFFVYVPVRIDWTAGQWSEGEQCFALDNGRLSPDGCNLRIAANPGPREEGSVTMYAQPQDDPYNSRSVSIHSSSLVQFLTARPLVDWKSGGDRFSCTFDDMWLRVSIDGAEGWVHSQADFAALGLPPLTPPQ